MDLSSVFMNIVPLLLERFRGVEGVEGVDMGIGPQTGFYGVPYGSRQLPKICLVVGKAIKILFRIKRIKIKHYGRVGHQAMGSFQRPVLIWIPICTIAVANTPI